PDDLRVGTHYTGRGGVEDRRTGPRRRREVAVTTAHTCHREPPLRSHQLPDPVWVTHVARERDEGPIRNGWRGPYSRCVARANDPVAEALSEYAELLAITGGDPYRLRNYEKAARSVAGYHLDVAALDEPGLEDIPGVGKSIAAKIVEILDHGSFDELDARRSQVPAGVRSLLAVPGLGPKRAL